MFIWSQVTMFPDHYQTFFKLITPWYPLLLVLSIFLFFLFVSFLADKIYLFWESFNCLKTKQIPQRRVILKIQDFLICFALCFLKLPIGHGS